MSFLSIEEEDSASGVTMVEGRKMNAAVSFMDWANNDFGAVKRKSFDLERMESGVSCGDSSGSGEFVSRFCENGRIGHSWLGQMQMQMQIQQRHVNLKAADEMHLKKNRLQSTAYSRYVEDCGGVENKGSSPGSTGEGNSLRAHGATGEEKYRRVHCMVGNNGSLPGATGEGNSLRATGATEEGKYRRVNCVVENNGCLPGATVEGNSLRAPGATGEEKYRRVNSVVENNGCPPGATGEGNSLRGGATGEEKYRRVHMFDKAVTPSDVGKLNRLVIPKHQAEKYFPLDTNEKDKGLLLTFRDSSGKEWRFRYSYWSSSQSYVLTKGWSRFVREMKLHAGDVVSFHRAAAAAGDADANHNIHHFYITWKRRAAKAPLFFSPFEHPKSPSPPPTSSSQWVSFASAMPAAPPLWAERLSAGANWGRETPQMMKLSPVQQPPTENHAVGNEKSQKRIRLFGVNL